MTSRRGRYLVAIALTASAAAIRVLLALTVEPRPPILVLTVGAVGVAAWYGGLGPGLLATVLCAIIGLFFLDPQFSIDIEHASDLIDVGVFIIVGTGMAWVCESLHRARRDAIQARRAAEQAANRERDTLKEAERRKDEFIAVLAHELRNPLAPLCNAAAFLRRSAQQWTGEQLRCLDLIDRQVYRMTRLLDDLLDVSRISRGKLLLHRQRVSLSTALQHAIESAEPLIAAKAHKLEVALVPTDLDLFADPIRVVQIFSNILTNAAKYTDPGGRIALRVTPGERAVDVEISDSGIGIDAGHMPHLFEMFSQSEAARSRCEGGLGLGLGLTRGLVEMHGGSIRASSGGPGQGSTFVVHLPLAEPAPPEMRRPQPELFTTKALRVLVADDNVDAAESLGMLLELHGCTVRTVHDGEAAVREAADFRPDVAFLDIGMPHMDGYEACRRIRAAPWGRDTVLVALTGWGQDQDRRRCAEAGFDRHLTKPADPQQVFAILAAHQVDVPVDAPLAAPAPT